MKFKMRFLALVAIVSLMGCTTPTKDTNKTTFETRTKEYATIDSNNDGVLNDEDIANVRKVEVIQSETKDTPITEIIMENAVPWIIILAPAIY